MQKSNLNDNNKNVQLFAPTSPSLSSTSTTTSSSTTSGQTARRTYNRSHNNNFKFHNFVFNETNQKFCLEEQHGNKKITVLHWKKTGQNEDEQMEHKKGVRNCDSDSKLIKSDKISCNIPCLWDDNENDDEMKPNVKIKDDDKMDMIGNGPLSSSASFPLARLNRCLVDPRTPMMMMMMNECLDKSSLPQQEEHPSEISSGHSSASFLSRLESSSSSSNNNFSSLSKFSSISDANKFSDESMISKSQNSGSSIAATNSSSSCSAINFSLDNLRLNENLYRNNAARNYHCKPITNNRVCRAFIDDDDDDDDSEDSDFDEDKEDLFFQTYRQKIQQRIESLFDNHSEQQQQPEQSQPLDLSTKSRYDFNNNDNAKDDNVDRIIVDDYPILNDTNRYRDDETASTDSLMSTRRFMDERSTLSSDSDQHTRYQVPSWMSERHLPMNLDSIRNESLSPSQLISSIKCCSPLSDSCLERNNNKERIHHIDVESLDNPFMFRDKRIIETTTFPTTTTTTTAASLADDYQPRTSRSGDIFDALLEEEIHKFLHGSGSSFSPIKRQLSTTSLSSTTATDINKKIEDKLKLLQQEVLQNKLSEKNFFNFMSNTTCKDDPLRMHFKFDSNKNLEPYFMDSYRTGSPMTNIGTSNSSQLFSQSMNSYGTMTTTPKTSRLNHRNQIRRHLEDAFKQNGFLVKTKQVSDANNSATFCKFRQLRKYTRYYLKSWQNHLPDEVNKLWKGFLPPKSERPLFLTRTSAIDDLTMPTMMATSDNKTLATNTNASTTSSTQSSTTSTMMNQFMSSMD